MVDKPDFNKLKNKFDITSIMDNLKSIISSTSPLSDINPSDALDQKISAANEIMHTLQQQHEASAKVFEELNRMMQGMFLDLQAIRKENLALKAEHAVVENVTPPVAKTPEPIIEKETPQTHDPMIENEIPPEIKPENKPE